MKKILDRIKADPRYQKNIEYGLPRDGHPEGKVKLHIADLEANLEILANRNISEDNYWKLKLIIHTHDSFKAEAEKKLPSTAPLHHASLAREYTSQFIDDADLLNMIQFHDENYYLWQQYQERGDFDRKRFQDLLDLIDDWDLFLMFIIIDGCTAGKEPGKLSWFIKEVRKHKKTLVDSSWIIPPSRYRSHRE